MRALFLAALAVMLSACGGNYCPTDFHCLDAPPPELSIPAPHH